MTIISTQRLAQVFVDVADTLVDEFDVIEFLHKLTRHTAELLGEAPVGLMLANQRGQLQFVAGSDEHVQSLELFQIQNQQGPCLDAFHSGTAVVNADLRKDTDRWPLFAPRAVAAGFLAVHAFPLRLRSERIGALNVFSAHAGRHLDQSDTHLVQALADIASIGLLQERAISRGELLTEQLQGALNSRITIEQAKGAIAHQRGVTVDEAFILIRNYARNNNRKLNDVAHAIVEDPTTILDLT